MIDPPRWSDEDLKRNADIAQNTFRRARLDEPRDQYTRFFEQFVPAFRELIEQLPEITARKPDLETLLAVLRKGPMQTAFRYLAAPPISEDDLKILAETKLSPSALRRDPKKAKQVRDVVLHVIDPHRFPWVAESRLPSRLEREIAVAASAALVAAQRTATARRSRSKQLQEAKIKSVLGKMKYREVKGRDVTVIKDGPGPGEFCGESKFGGTKADLLIGLLDGRIMALECKVSNSGVNSYKRLNHEAVRKARTWLDRYGTNGVVPAALLGGVFHVANLAEAQKHGLTLFWDHDLRPFSKWLAGIAAVKRRPR